MKTRFSIVKISILILGLFFIQAQGQVTVSSLSDLKPYLKTSNANVKLTPGVYTITASDIKAGLYPDNTDIGGYYNRVLFLVEGNDSTYDFTDVTINIETGVFAASNSSVHEIQIIGNNNVLKNLRMADIGSVYDDPIDGGVNIAIDGRNNRIEGFHMTTKGSKPYGYGDAFGKGGGPVIAHNKHSSINVRGEYNHVLNCTIIHRSFGHAIFMQAASYPTIEGCYIEGELRTTDDILLEEGTGTSADNVDFMTDWGYRLPAGYMLSTGEAGIRAYNVGRTIVDGVQIGPLGANNVTVLNCTIKHMRTAVTLGHATGTKHVEGCVSIGNEQAFAVGDKGSVINCYSDAAFGPVYKSTYNSDDNSEIDITLIPPVDDYYNGSNCVMYLGGSEHNATLKSNDPNVNPDLKIQMGGFYNNLRMLNGTNASQNNHYATDVTITNNTEYSIEFPSESKDNIGFSCGDITDDGTGNLISECPEKPDFLDVNSTYFINNPRWTSRLSADGGETINLTDETTVGDNVEWKITPSEDTGYYFIDCVGVSPNVRITGNGTSIPILEPITEVSSASKWRFDMYDEDLGLFLITNQNNERLRVNNTEVDVVDSSSSGSYTRFSFTEASTLSLDGKEFGDSVNLYPNPTFSNLNINLNNNITARVDIVNLFGQIIVSEEINNGVIQIDLSSISNGVYIVKIHSSNNTFAKRIVKK